MAKKYVYFFGGAKADGKESMKNLLGGKGANLAEMAGNKDLKLPVPPGFTITTDVCAHYYKNKKKISKRSERRSFKSDGKNRKTYGSKIRRSK